MRSIFKLFKRKNKSEVDYSSLDVEHLKKLVIVNDLAKKTTNESLILKLVDTNIESVLLNLSERKDIKHPRTLLDNLIIILDDNWSNKNKRRDIFEAISKLNCLNEKDIVMLTSLSTKETANEKEAHNTPILMFLRNLKLTSNSIYHIFTYHKNLFLNFEWPKGTEYERNRDLQYLSRKILGLEKVPNIVLKEICRLSIDDKDLIAKAERILLENFDGNVEKLTKFLND